LAFTGREVDRTGLSFYRARYYDSRLQRFVSEDPLAPPSGEINSFAYVANAPADRVDPTGELWFVAPAIGGVVGGGIDLGIQLWRNGGNFGCVSWSSVGTSAVIGALTSSLGPSGPFLGRLRYGAPRWFGNLNMGTSRFGWSFDQGRNWLMRHGGIPKTVGHWHPPWRLPGPRESGVLGFGIGGGLLGGAAGAAGGAGSCAPAPPPEPSGADGGSMAGRKGD